MVVTGDAEGKIKFFDSELKMVNWYEDTMKYGPLCSISFSYSPNIAMIKSKMAAGRRSCNNQWHEKTCSLTVELYDVLSLTIGMLIS
jgi:hypothetical protein